MKLSDEQYEKARNEAETEPANQKCTPISPMSHQNPNKPPLVPPHSVNKPPYVHQNQRT